MSWKRNAKRTALLAGEEGRQRKARGASLEICLAYPNRYRTGMSNLGFQTVYALINSHADCLCERVFLPDPDEEMPAGGPRSLESQRPLGDFDIVAFSLSFENDYPQILTLLEAAGIPLEAASRGAGTPLVVAGGIAVTLNPEPLADFFDLFLLGEGEAVLPPFLDLAAAEARRLPREALLCRIQERIAGAYVPGCYRVSYGPDRRIAAFEPLLPAYPRRIQKPWAASLEGFATEQVITTAETEFGSMFLTEVSRGCSRGCRFCAAGFVCRPTRFRSLETLAGSFDRGLQKRRTIGLLGTAVSDHPALPSLCRAIVSRGGAAAIGSLRLDRIGPEVAALLREMGVKTVSLAPEAGSQRLRNVIRKGITEGEIFSAVEKLIDCDILQVKLYFMVGLPTEEDEDAEAIVRLVKGMADHARQYSGGTKGFRRLAVGLNQFIPKPATPFQWHPLEEAAVVKRRIRRIADGLRGEKAVRVTHDLPKWNYVQALLSLGDRSVGQFLLTVHRLGGNWPQAFREVDIQPDFYVRRRKGIDEKLPWDFIDHGVDKAFLAAEYRRALSESLPMPGGEE